MGIIPVAVQFKLPENKIIRFSVLKKSGFKAVLSNHETKYGYAADMAFLDLYTNGITQI